MLLSLASKFKPVSAIENILKVMSSFRLVVEDNQEMNEQLSLVSIEVEKLVYLELSKIPTYRKFEKVVIPLISMEPKNVEIKGVARTTNAVEVWHYCFQAFLGFGSKFLKNTGKFEVRCSN